MLRGQRVIVGHEVERFVGLLQVDGGSDCIRVLGVGFLIEGNSTIDPTTTHIWLAGGACTAGNVLNNRGQSLLPTVNGIYQDFDGIQANNITGNDMRGASVAADIRIIQAAAFPIVNAVTWPIAAVGIAGDLQDTNLFATFVKV